MKIHYAKMNPTENITLLAEGDIARRDYPRAAAALMEAEPDAEQVGFIEPPTEQTDIRLQMAGGEFCGNATLSAAALHCLREHVACGASRQVRVCVSGAAAPIAVDMTALGAQRFAGSLDMPLPLRISVCTFACPGGERRLPVVEFAGISHVIVSDGMRREEAQTVIPRWCAQLGCDALGIMLWDSPAGRLAPLVYVPAAGTLCWEHSCASGSTAVGAYTAFSTGHDARLSLAQPGGTLHVSTQWCGDKITRLRLSGAVRVMALAQLDWAEKS